MSLQLIQIGLIGSALVWLGSLLPVMAAPAVLYADEPGSQINLRSAPTTQSASPSYGIPGDKVETLRAVKGADGYTWYYIRFDRSGAEGWVRGDLIRFLTSTDPSKQHCQAALMVKQRFETKYKVTVTYLVRSDISNVSVDAPKGRTNLYVFAMEGSAVASLLRSSQVLTAAAREVIQGCDQIGLVSFGLDQTDDVGSYGLFPDGRIRPFRCVEPDANRRQIQWGQTFCP